MAKKLTISFFKKITNLYRIFFAKVYPVSIIILFLQHSVYYVVIVKGAFIMENLSKIREISGISPKVMSKLLNVTVYTYNAFEKGNMTPSPEIIKMISMIYEVDEALLTDDSLQLDQETENRLMAISALPENERYIHLYSHILEKGQVPNYRNIKRVKERIREMLWVKH